MTEKRFDQQVAIVTGAGVGIGFAIARQLALQGAAVLLNDMDDDLAKEAAAKITAEGGICEGRGGDMSDVATIRALVEYVVKTNGKLNLLAANAGLTSWGGFFDYTPEKFEQVVNLNLRGTFFLTQAAARQMRAQGTGGRIVFTSSVTGHQAVRYLAAYAMSKAALEMLAKNLVLELAPHHITVNAVAPGATLTPRNLQDDPHYDTTWGNLIPTGQVAMPDDIAQAILFLLSPQAAQITGQTLIVDGGWSVTSPIPSLDFVENHA